MKYSNRSRQVANLAEPTQRRLNMYALAAAAAGVGALAAPSPAEAKVVYTPVHQSLDGYYQLDVNHDGVADFTFSFLEDCVTSTCKQWLQVYSAPPGNAIVAEVTSSLPEVRPLWPGGVVGPKRRLWSRDGFIEGAAQIFRTRNHSKTYVSYKYWGPWANGGKGFHGRYIGLEFLIKGKVHYGWARVNTTGGWKNLGVLTGYAYETIAGKPIVAGATKDDVTKNPENGQPGSSTPQVSVTNKYRCTLPPTSLGILAIGARTMPPAKGTLEGK